MMSPQIDSNTPHKIEYVKRIIILGSTGSIGRSTLDVIDQHRHRFDLYAIAANSRIDILEKQYYKYLPKFICVLDQQKGKELRQRLHKESVEILIGETDMLAMITESKSEIVVNAIVGSAGLMASLATIKAGINLALANKESLVTGGPLFKRLLKESGSKLFPIDSEHSAIWQSVGSADPSHIKNIILTASGGPFKDLPKEKLSEVTVVQALNHPTWKMGKKITIDSATLANKGLEVIEAVYLFDILPSKVKVVIHPQSIIHSMVEYIDSSIIAQMSKPDMRLPITYALFWPIRVESSFGQLNLTEISKLTFAKPDLEKFRMLRIAFEVAESGGTSSAIYNAANEIAVAAFLNNKLSFDRIPDVVNFTLDKIAIVAQPELDHILDADNKARELAKKFIEDK